MTELIAADSRPEVMELEPGTYWWCACGRSKKQPWCDGAHSGSGITPTEVVIEEKRRAAMCLCKQTGNKPFCDGAHKTIAD